MVVYVPSGRSIGGKVIFDAKDTSPALSKEALDRIGVLFDIERRIKDADLETQRRVRAIDTREALARIHAWLLEHVHRQRPSSPIGKAFAYALNPWTFLEVYASRPETPLHTKMSELQFRRPVIGRKNWLFARSEGAAQAAATLLSLVGSCRLHGIDPWEYLHTVLGGHQRPAGEQGRRPGADPCRAGAGGRGGRPARAVKRGSPRGYNAPQTRR